MTLIEQLRDLNPLDTTADLLESQAARIAELEAALDQSQLTGVKFARRIAELEVELESTRAKNFEVLMALGDRAEELAALLRKIDEAPVVAHISHNGQVFSNGFVYETDKPLISKEDLK